VFSKFKLVRWEIDPAPFQLQGHTVAILATAKQLVEILKSNDEQATANVKGLIAQTLVADDANTQFQAQDK